MQKSIDRAHLVAYIPPQIGAICVSKAVKTGDEWSTALAFKNAACILKVGVSGSEVTRLQISAVGGELISGAFAVSIDGNGEPVIGASVRVENATVTISGCTFTGNKGDGNALLCAGTGAVVTMEDCEYGLLHKSQLPRQSRSQ